LEAIRVAALEAGANAAVPSWHWGEGGKGALELAKAVIETCSADKQSFRFLYDLNTSIEEKVAIVSKEVYGADGVEFSEEAKKKAALYEHQVLPTKVLFLNCRDLGNYLFVLQRHNTRSRQIQMQRVYRRALQFQFVISEFLEALGLLLC